MEKSETIERFDCVKMMREIRDEITKETAEMSLDELRTYMKKAIEGANIVATDKSKD